MTKVDDRDEADPALLERRRQLAARIQWARAQRGLTNEQIGEALGSSGNAFHVALNRLATGKRNTDPKLDWGERLAAVLGVSLHWLATGQGDPHGGFPDEPPDPDYPNRRTASAAARMVQLAPEAIEKVRRETPPRDLTADQWLDRIATESRTIRSSQ